MRNLFKKRRRYLSDELPWFAHQSYRGRRCITYTHDGAWMMHLDLCGPDMAYRDIEARFRHMSRFNNALHRLGSGYALWFEEQHNPYTCYPEIATDREAARVFELERAHLFEQGRAHYDTAQFYSVLFRPPMAWQAKLRRMMVDDDPDNDEASAYAQHLSRFVEVVEAMRQMLTGFMPRVETLSDGELLTYLHSTISAKRHAVGPLGRDELLPGSLIDQPFTGGLYPKLGHPHEQHDVFVIGIHNYPTFVEGAMLRALRDLPVFWRRVSRWLPQNRHESDKEIKRAWSKAAMARKPAGVQVMETVSTHPMSTRINPVADQTLADAEEAERELARGKVCRGYVTNSFVVLVPSAWGATWLAGEIAGALRELGVAVPDDGRFAKLVGRLGRRVGLARLGTIQQAREVQRIVNNLGFVAEIESFNAAEAWLGTIPGNLFPDVNRHGVNSAVVSCIAPIDTPWTGEPWNAHLDCPALMQVTRDGCCPFHLNLHVGDVGHALVTGWTGGGKSTLLNALVLSFLARVPHGQVFRLDKGRASKVTTLALGGRFVDMALENSAVQPLRLLETAADRTWAYGWLMALVAEVDEARAKSPDTENAISMALDTFRRTVPPDLRTITALSATVQDFWIKQVLRPYTAEGDFGHIFDGINEHDYAEPIVTFEIGPMLDQPTIIKPLASFLFHLADRRASPDSPMLAMLDEGHAYMVPPFDRQVLLRMREGRSKFLQIIFASQSFLDFADSPIAPVLIANCPSRIFIPDPDARESRSAALLESFGLQRSEIEALAQAQPKAQYALSQKVSDPNAGGFVIFDLTLGPAGLALCASTNTRSQALADKVLARWGGRHFLHGWLMEHGLAEAAAALVDQPLAATAAE